MARLRGESAAKRAGDSAWSRSSRTQVIVPRGRSRFATAPYPTCASMNRTSTSGWITRLPAEHPGEDQRGDDGGVGLDHEPLGVGIELAPGDLLVRHRARVGAVAGRGVADLTVVAPATGVGEAEVLRE